MASKGAIRAGLSWAEFWAATPYQTRIIGEAWADNRKLERNLTMTAAYMTARLSLADPKQFPDLQEFLGEDDTKPDVQQTPSEFSAKFMHWAIRNGLETDDGADP
jgi:hypothetical protein